MEARVIRSRLLLTLAEEVAPAHAGLGSSDLSYELWADAGQAMEDTVEGFGGVDDSSAGGDGT